VNEIVVKGRGLKEPRCSLQRRPDGVVVRLDDDANPEFWVEILLPNNVTTEEGVSLRLTVQKPEGGAA
jgi:hypothetical protein